MKFLILALALFAGFVGTARAQSSADGSIRVAAPWARASVSPVGGAFLTIVNKGASDDRLTAVTTPVAATAELHRTENDNGIMKMIPVDGIEVKAGQAVVLAPGGYHVMLMQLKAPLKEGTSFPMTLTFEKAGKIDVTVKVGKVGAMGADDMGGMNMN